MKKLVLLLQKPSVDIHLRAILMLLILALIAIPPGLFAIIFVSFTFLVVMPFYSYSSGFSWGKYDYSRLTNSLSFLVLLLMSFLFFFNSFTMIIFFCYFGKIDISQKEILNSMDKKTLNNIFILFLLTSAAWMISVVKIRKQGIKKSWQKIA